MLVHPLWLQQQLTCGLGLTSAHWAPGIWKLKLEVQHFKRSTLASKLGLNNSSFIETQHDAIHNTQDISHLSQVGIQT